MSGNRRVSLRAEEKDGDSRYLDAYVDDDGNLHIDGQDLGPGTGSVSSDGEYEWFRLINKADIPRLKKLLRAPVDADILDVLEKSWRGYRSYRLEEIIRDSDLPSGITTWSG